MEKVEYGASRGARLSNKDAQTYGPELNSIKEANGGLLPEMVVEAATDPASPLHAAFEWDDKKAAHFGRIEQAKYLIRSVVIRHIKGQQDGPKHVHVEVKAFHNVINDGNRAYLSIDDIRKDPLLRKQLVIQAYNELKGWERRHKQFSELSRVTKFLDRLDITAQIEALD